ncbi:MAG: cupin domain-containing protein [Thermodesulfobacteriota bacterium]
MFFPYPHGYKELRLAPGAEVKLAWGDGLMIQYATLAPNVTMPAHSHPHEQMGLIIEGEVTLTIGEETQVCRKGDAYLIPPNVLHGGTSGPCTTVAVEVFHPPREDYIRRIKAE